MSSRFGALDGNPGLGVLGRLQEAFGIVVGELGLGQGAAIALEGKTHDAGAHEQREPRASIRLLARASELEVDEVARGFAVEERHSRE